MVSGYIPILLYPLLAEEASVEDFSILTEDFKYLQTENNFNIEVEH